MTMIPAPPELTCIRCTGERFTPLTFPDVSDESKLPTAKCVACGLR
jgi:hypothetical protein